MKTFLKTFIADESGASAAEYALILAIVGVGIGAAALTLGANVKQAIGNAASDVYKCNNTTSVTASSSVNSAACTGNAG
ncbi:Flp family type IVb pilin [Novosphingobium sp. ZN18A2]|uniref:Flp family type IVb pilin n=1 Tax=Novosphingobium sp. ZN18A2 TaxID=3079861 RepID=UPI0030CC1C85